MESQGFYKELYRGKLTGVSFEPARSGIIWLFDTVVNYDDIILTMFHDSENKYDKNAIRVYSQYNGETKEVGWIPKEVNKSVLQCGLENANVKFLGFNMKDANPVGIDVVVYVGC